MSKSNEQDIADLAHDLMQEKLFVDSEKHHLCSLNEEIAKAAEEVFRACWLRGEQRRNYHDLLHPNSSPAACCFRANSLHMLQFIPSHKVLGRLDGLYAALLQGLRDSPSLVAHALATGERSRPEAVRPLLHTLYCSLYAGCVLTHDHASVLTLLRELLQLQVCSNADPHRLLRHGSCAFSQLFRTYVETLPQAKVFLTSALHEPLLELLAEDELFLDMDPGKAPLRFTPQVRARRFGVEGTPEYEAALEKYQTKVILRLAKLTNRFLSQLSSSMHCFPPTLLWLVRSLYRLLLQSRLSNGGTPGHDLHHAAVYNIYEETSPGDPAASAEGNAAGRGINGGLEVTAALPPPSSSLNNCVDHQAASIGVSNHTLSTGMNGSLLGHGSSRNQCCPRTAEVTACCLDLVFIQFLCPAMVEPESHGIIDAPVSHVARFNLMQVAQCIQALAMNRCEVAADARLANVLPHLNTALVAEVVSTIIEGGCGEQPHLAPAGEGARVVLAADIVREVCLIPHPHLEQLLHFLHMVLPLLPTDEPYRSELEALLARLPAPVLPPCIPAPPSPTPEHPITTTPSKKGIMNKVKMSSHKHRASKASSEAASEGGEASSQAGAEGGAASEDTLSGSGGRGSGGSSPRATTRINHVLNAIGSSGGTANSNSLTVSAGGETPLQVLNSPVLGYDCVLMVSLNSASHSLLPGLMPEEKLLASLKCRSGGSSNGSIGEEGGSSSKVGDMVVEKRTRFSLSHDEGSIGNTSDNLEAVSEAASNHSVESSLDDVEQEDQPDNLSDMMSANVSGRGTPNVSGRETPSSQVTEGEDGGAGALRDPGGPGDPEGRRSPPQQNMAAALPKPAREDIEEKFGKFEIKPLVGGDETFSLVSDTWSTDVLASDSETIEAADRELREERQDFHDQLLNRHLQELDRMQGGGPYRGDEAAGETFETASEAWSTDVLTSDSERLQEFDTDDSQSVARSDDAGRSEVDESVAGSDNRDLLLPRRDLLQQCGVADGISLRPHHSRFHVDVTVPAGSRLEAFAARGAGASNDGESSALAENTASGESHAASAVLKSPPPLLLPASLSLDSGSASSSNGTPKPLPIMQINNGGEDLLLPSSAPPIIGFRSVISTSSSGTIDLLNTSVNCNDMVLPIRQSGGNTPSNFATSNLQGSSSDMKMLSQNLQVLSLHSGSITSKKLNSTGNISLDDRRDNSLSSQKKSKLMLGSSAEDSSLHLSTTSLASSTSSSCELNGRTGVPIRESASGPDTLDLADIECSGATGSSDGGATGRTACLMDVNNDDADVLSATSDYSGAASTSAGDYGHASHSMDDGGETVLSDGGAARPLCNGVAGIGECKDHVDGASEECNNLSFTGAIPKSISFDKTAEHGGDRDVTAADVKNKKSFFKSFKLQVFKGRRKGGSGPPLPLTRSLDSDLPYVVSRGGPGASGSSFRRGLTEDSVSSRPDTIEETTDDILAKYRGRGDGDPRTNGGGRPQTCERRASVEDERLLIDTSNVEASYAFVDAKRKLRLVLSMADSAVPFALHATAGQRHLATRRAGDLEKLVSGEARDCSGALSRWLALQMAEARSLQDSELLAQLTEALRCLQLFDTEVEGQLLTGLREDYEHRAPYIAYLVRARQGLLTTLYSLRRVSRRVERDTDVVRRSLVAKCVQLFLERRDLQLREFTRAFTTLRAPDEKVLHVASFLDNLVNQIRHDDSWRDISEELLSSAEGALEQSVMAHIYDYALYPNGEADINRDQVLHEHIQKLAAVVTPNHKDLCIPKLYQYECPWPSAQQELLLLAAYKTAGDKLSCVVRSAETVLNLLSLAHASSVPAADDCMPVLIYVIIKANPRHLLSTIQYVNVYFEHRMEGEQRYYWTQFCSAVEFIKTMDYNYNN